MEISKKRKTLKDKRPKSFRQLLNAKGHEFVSSWLIKISKILDGTSEKYELVEIEKCLCLKKRGTSIWIDQLYSTSTWQQFYWYYKIEGTSITVDSLKEVMETQGINHIAHVCGRGRKGKGTNQEPVCIKKEHLSMESRIDNEVHKHFHFFLNYNDDSDPDFSQSVRELSSQFFKKDLSKLYKKYFNDE